MPSPRSKLVAAIGGIGLGVALSSNAMTPAQRPQAPTPVVQQRPTPAPVAQPRPAPAPVVQPRIAPTPVVQPRPAPKEIVFPTAPPPASTTQPKTQVTIREGNVYGVAPAVVVPLRKGGELEIKGPDLHPQVPPAAGGSISVTLPLPDGTKK